MKQIGLGLIILNLLLSATIFGQVPSRGAGNNPAKKRLALVIGNGAYQRTTTLVNPAIDATDMAQSLRSLGFEVLSGTNQSKRQMEMLIREFGEKLTKK